MCDNLPTASEVPTEGPSEVPTEDPLEIACRASLDNVLARTGGPFGAAIVNSTTREVVAVSSNSVTTDNDPTAHAEVNAIRAACRRLGTFSLSGHTLYTSCEPCPMCLGAIYWARLDRVCYANTSSDAASIDFDDAMIYDELRKDVGDRQLEFAHVPNETARRAFSLWQSLLHRNDGCGCVKY
jgi:guanine deaminase